MSTEGRHLLVDEPAPHVRRRTLNRPEKRNGVRAAIRAGTELA